MSIPVDSRSGRQQPARAGGDSTPFAERARTLGWAAVEVIDDDLGRSGSGIARPGFEKKLLAAICEGRVVAAVVLHDREPRGSRVMGRTGIPLLEFCGLVGTLIIDEGRCLRATIDPNDRLLLGMKGTMSEMELSLFRQRSLEALKQKARRGELAFTSDRDAVGYPPRCAMIRIEQRSRSTDPGSDLSGLQQVRRTSDGPPRVSFCGGCANRSGCRCLR